MYHRMKKNRDIGSSQEFEDDQESVTSLKEWNWKLEQSISHLQARINAVENRLSYHPPKTSQSVTNVHNHHSEESTSTDESYEKILTVIDQYEKTLINLDQSYQELQQQMMLFEQKQKSSSIIMHVNGREVPLEITGIIGGIITLLIAFIIGFGGIDIVISPGFLSIIGLVLIGGTFFRSFGGIELLKSLINKKTDQTY